MGGHGHAPPPPPPATEAEMKAAKLPLHNRDSCASILIPLNKCRHETFFLPWKCEHERHAYEACQYYDYQTRKEMKAEERAAELA